MNEEIDDKTYSTLGINCNQGKIYLTKNVSASTFRSWSVKRIKDIISYLKIPDKSKDFEIFKAQNIMNDAIWNGFNSTQKGILEKIVFAVFVNKMQGKDAITLDIDFEEIWKQLYPSFYKNLIFNCDQCNDMCFAYCDQCGSSNLNLAKKGILYCNECGNQQDGSYVVCCEEGHSNSFESIRDFIILYPLKELFEKISTVLLNHFQISVDTLQENFYIQDGTIIFTKQSKGDYIKASDINELRVITDRTLNTLKYDTLIAEFNKIQEKCENTNNKNCNTCTLSDQNLCIMKIFTVYDEFRPSPHQGSEFGDVNFPITYQGQKIQLVGIAKSRNGKGDVLNLSDNATREMLQQFLTMTHDKRVGMIALICPMRFHPQLVEELKYISRITKVPMTVLDEMFMIKLLDYYNEIKSKSLAG